jgi:hypothetical protein
VTNSLLPQLDTILPITQILFYVSAALVAWLTYRSARRGLLSPVNTEYQRRVIDRLSELSTSIWAEFEEHPDGLINVFVNEILCRLENPDERAAVDVAAVSTEAISGSRFATAQRLDKIYWSYWNDPFVPPNILAAFLPILKHRIWAMSVAAEKTLDIVKTNGVRPDLEQFVAITFAQQLPSEHSARRTRDRASGIRQRIRLHLQSFHPLR